MTPLQLNPYLEKWETKWHDDGGKAINNPKIPIKFIRSVGTLVYKAAPTKPVSDELTLT